MNKRGGGRAVGVSLISGVVERVLGAGIVKPKDRKPVNGEPTSNALLDDHSR